MNFIFLSGTITNNPLFKTIHDHRLCQIKLIVKNNQHDSSFVIIDIEAWDSLANTIQKLNIKKNDQINVEGQLKMNIWLDKKTGIERNKLYVSASNIFILKNSNFQEEKREKKILKTFSKRKI